MKKSKDYEVRVKDLDQHLLELEQKQLSKNEDRELLGAHLMKLKAAWGKSCPSGQAAA